MFRSMSIWKHEKLRIAVKSYVGKKIVFNRHNVFRHWFCFNFGESTFSSVSFGTWVCTCTATCLNWDIFNYPSVGFQVDFSDPFYEAKSMNLRVEMKIDSLMDTPIPIEFVWIFILSIFNFTIKFNLKKKKKYSLLNSIWILCNHLGTQNDF